MTNNEIIINQAIAHGIYTKAEAQAIVAAKGCLPIHTFAEWKKAGYSVKRGEHAAITCDLWKYTERPGKAAKAARHDHKTCANSNAPSQGHTARRGCFPVVFCLKSLYYRHCTKQFWRFSYYVDLSLTSWHFEDRAPD